MEHLLSALLDALADPTVSYIGLGYDTTVGISTGKCKHCTHTFTTEQRIG